MRFSSVRNKNAFESFLELGRAVAHLSKTVSLGWPVSTVYCVSSCASSMADLRWGSICAPYDSEWVAERELQTRRLGAILAEALLTGDIAERLG